MYQYIYLKEIITLKIYYSKSNKQYYALFPHTPSYLNQLIKSLHMESY